MPRTKMNTTANITPNAGPDARQITATKRYLPWVVAAALFMEQLDSTIVNTGIPAMAASLGVSPLSLKAVVTSYILALAVSIPVSGWLAERFGSKQVFMSAVAIFTLSSLLCGLAVNAPMLVAARIPQGIGAAMMMPVGRMAMLHTFDKSELLKAMNFVIIPALLGPLLGPTVGGLIVHWLSWRDMFFVNLPVGMLLLFFANRHMPNYRAKERRPLDVKGLLLFGSGVGILSWLLEIFGEHGLSNAQALGWLGLSLGLIGSYVYHALHCTYPLLDLALFKIRTFRVSVLGGFVTRLGVGGMPFLLPLLFQVGLGMPVNSADHLLFIVLLGALMGLFNSLQFSSMNSMAYADVKEDDSAMASTIASTLQQMSMSFGLACGSLVTAYFLGHVPQTNGVAVTQAIHHAFWTLAAMTALSSFAFWSLRPGDGANVSGGPRRS